MNSSMTSKQLTAQPISEIAVISAAEIVQHLKLTRQMPRILARVVNQKIIEHTATKHKIKLSEQELQTAADRFRYEKELISSTATVNWLEKYHLSVTEFEQLIQNTLLAKKLAQHLFQNQIEAHFYANQLNYYQAVIYEIVIADADLAMELYYGIQEQELSFWNLAHEYIEDQELRRRGGYQGKKGRTQLHPEIAAAVFLQTRENLPLVLKPIMINKKTHLIYVEEIIEPNLDKPLRQTIQNQLFENWLAQQRQQLAEHLQLKNDAIS